MPVAIEEVYERFDAGLRGFVSARVRDPDAAEDVLQDVYLKIHARIDTLEDEDKVGAWVYRVARNAVTDHYRAKRLFSELGDVPDEPAHDVEQRELDERLKETVSGMLDGLPPDHREALYLTEYEGLTQKQLAQRLGISLSGAKSRVQRARTRLKTLLLACCHFELDALGRVIDYGPRRECCEVSGPGAWRATRREPFGR
ncbi:MAG: RNA polymerase sigma factor SigZ [Rubrobacter sp.]